MKTKSAKKSKRVSSKKPAVRSAEPVSIPPSEVSTTRTTTVLDSTDPRVLLHLAEEEPDQRVLSEYVPVIETLRRKSFSYREIAEWFSEHGVDLDHNAVYRLYTKHLSDYEAAMEEQRADDEERDEAFRQGR